MAELYTLTLTVRALMVTLPITLCVLTQTLVIVLCYYRRSIGQGRRRIIELTLELLVLFHIIVLSLPQGEGYQAQYASILVPAGYVRSRYLAAALTALFAAIAAARLKKAWLLLVAAAACLTLPALESTGVYVWLYLAALYCYLLRAGRLCVLRYRELKTGISALSVKELIDSMRAGIVFYKPDGFITLANAKMRELMIAATGKIQRNGKYFYELLSSGRLRGGCQKAEHEGQILCLLPDNTAWMFTRTELRIGYGRYVQLAASDISEQWKLTTRLQEQETVLKRHSEELKKAIGNLHILSRERELQKAKARAHDSFGQRLTLLLRAIHGEQGLDIALLRSLSQGLEDDLQAEQNRIAPLKRLESLQQTYRPAGVTIQVDGTLPEKSENGHIAIDIIRECAANAVRHAFATEVYARVRGADGRFHIELRDNGSAPSKPLREGGGIGGMRRAVEQRGGTLEVTSSPGFVLKADLPESGTEGQYG